MYFKKLELFGFKSFADRTKLEFEPGVTAIVGPNGCGKSNISDSIKWVLGEQSAKELRGGKMEDVIFNGTDTTQAVNIAEVSLTLSNEDRSLPIEYDEVTITRRVFRSGESEYLLNKTQVRLKDINDLLAGTGIGTSSYSIAEQGKMDRVLSARPEDRREIFEEASGITKYKNRKKEALRKLEHTENNLARLSDIISEVKRQINSIERQAKKAEKYKLEFEHLKELDLKHSFYKYKNIKANKQEKDREFQLLKSKEGSFSLELNAHTMDFHTRRQELNFLEQEVLDAKTHLMSTTSTIEKNSSNIALNNGRINEIVSRREYLNTEIKQAQAKIEYLRKQIEQLQVTFDQLQSNKENKQISVQQGESTLSELSSNIKECEAIISKAKLDMMDNLSEQSRLKNSIAKAAADISALSHRHRRLAAEKESANTDITTRTEKFKVFESALQNELDKVNDCSRQLEQGRMALDSLTGRLPELDASIISLEKDLSSSVSKLDVLKSLTESNEGLSDGAKAYLKMIEASDEERRDFVGVLTDIIKVRPGYERALEACLGNELQSIVVKNEAAAKRALDYLKNNHKGIASFIILDKCIQRSEALNVHQAQNLSDFIEASGTNQALVWCLFEGIFLADSIDQAISMARGNKNIKVVTKDASCVTYNKITGGGIGPGEYTGLVGRRFRVEQLPGEIEELKRKIEILKNEKIDLLAQVDSCRKDVQAKEDVLRNEEKAFALRENDKTRERSELEKLEEEFNLVELELGELSQEQESLKRQNQLFNEKLCSVESAYQGLQELIAEKQKIIELSASEKEALLIGLAQIKTELSLLSEKYSSQEDTLNMLKDTQAKEQVNLNSRIQQIAEGDERVEFLKSESQRMMQENDILEEQKQQIGNKISDLGLKRDSMAAQIEKQEREALKRQQEMDELKDNISRLQINITELSYEADSIRSRIQQVYKADLDQQVITFDNNENWQQIEAEIHDFTDRIDKMGPVNLVAIEEHKELQERYDFLTSQQQDLINAKESLHKAINRINRTTRALFIETFDKIRVYFREYFRLLFGGGVADIYLIDQVDILESGIEIMVRPPGKKLQSISLLSGGEKALTSVALLFALFKVKPTPFCVLDEMDAPLDEANIDRFNRILGEFVQSTQFIIITHNKRTISIADVMYGITMEKSGISKIVSVKFAQEEIEKKERAADAQVQQQPVEEKSKAEPPAEENQKEPAAVD
ncbi:MAG: chromosome segregation protein SMC [Candidatus Omnitrophota bacterium]